MWVCEHCGAGNNPPEAAACRVCGAALSVTTNCPHCGNSIEAFAEHFGVILPCPHCGLEFEIPSPHLRPSLESQNPYERKAAQLAMKVESKHRHRRMLAIAALVVAGLIAIYALPYLILSAQGEYRREGARPDYEVWFPKLIDPRPRGDAEADPQTDAAEEDALPEADAQAQAKEPRSSGFVELFFAPLLALDRSHWHPNQRIAAGPGSESTAGAPGGDDPEGMNDSSAKAESQDPSSNAKGEGDAQESEFVRNLAWRLADSLPSADPSEDTFSLGEDGKSENVTMLVVSFGAAVEAAGYIVIGKEEFPADSEIKSDFWSAEVSTRDCKLDLPDGSTQIGGGMKEFMTENVGSGESGFQKGTFTMTHTETSEPKEPLPLEVFFVVNRDVIAGGGVRFQYKHYPSIELTESNRAPEEEPP